MDEHYRHDNEWSLQNGWRLLSSYRMSNGKRFWIITEADRSVTAFLLPGGILTDDENAEETQEQAAHSARVKVTPATLPAPQDASRPQLSQSLEQWDASLPSF